MTDPRMHLKTVTVRDDGCFSAVLWDGRWVFNAVERTFQPGEAKHGKRVVLGNGIFQAREDYYHKGGYKTFELQLDGHDRVLFHKGALEDHSLACVILGESLGGFNRLTKAYSGIAVDPELQTAILGSSLAFDEFMKLTAGLKEFNVMVSGR